MMNWLFCILAGGSFLAAVLLGRSGELANAMLSEGYRAVCVCLELMGTVGMWCGVLEIARRCGLVDRLDRLLAPLLDRIFPGLRRASREAMRQVSINVTANLLGLGSAATPSALIAMREMDRLNGGGKAASDDMVKFVVLNTACFQLLPTTVAAMRGAAGSEHPFDILIPVLLTTAAALTAAMGAAMLGCQRAGKSRKRPGGPPNDAAQCSAGRALRGRRA